MVWETTYKPLDVEELIKEMNLVWDSVFFSRKLRISKSIRFVEKKEKKSSTSKALKVK